MSKLPNPVDYAVPVFVLLIIVEMIWARFKAPEKYEPKDTLISLLFGFGSSVAGALTGALVFGLSMVGVYGIRITNIGLAGIYALVLVTESKGGFSGYLTHAVYFFAGAIWYKQGH